MVWLIDFDCLCDGFGSVPKIMVSDTYTFLYLQKTNQ